MAWFERLTARARASDPRVVDGGLALVAVVLGVLSVLSSDVSADQREPDGIAVALAVAVGATIAFRRTVPLTALTVGSALIGAHIAADYPEGLLPVVIFVLTYSVAVRMPPRRSWIALAEVGVVLVVLGLLDSHGLDTFGVVGEMAWFAVAWVMGFAIRTRRESEETRLHEAEERAELEQQRSALILAEERLRIAQELHDVVAHSMSVIAVQAGVGSHVLDERPDQARAALDAVSATSRGALAELRRLLGVLRNDDGVRSLVPAPGLGDLETLVADVRAAGVPVELTVSGSRADLPAGIELSAYRVVQEALTNILKHAGPSAHAEVRVAHLPDRLSIEVVDNGRGAAAHPMSDHSETGGGHGLLGMRERIELWGGALSAGPEPGGGFAVRAMIPYAESTS